MSSKAKLIFVFMIWCIAGISCDGLLDIPETVYVIAKGEHKSNIEGSIFGKVKFRTLKTDHLQFTARFDSTAIYDLNQKDGSDVNKLLGFSDCNSDHHENSARFGWRYYSDGLVEILAYVYREGKRVVKPLGFARIDETYVYSLVLGEDCYGFSFNDNPPVFVERAGKCKRGVYYMLFPYFGGNMAAPHEIRITIKELT